MASASNNSFPIHSSFAVRRPKFGGLESLTSIDQNCKETKINSFQILKQPSATKGHLAGGQPIRVSFIKIPTFIFFYAESLRVLEMLDCESFKSSSSRCREVIELRCDELTVSHHLWSYWIVNILRSYNNWSFACYSRKYFVIASKI